MKKIKALLIVIAVICIGVAASYPIRYKIELDSNNSELEDLSGMRRRVMEEQHLGIGPEDGEPSREAVPDEGTEEAEAPGKIEVSGDAEGTSTDTPEDTGVPSETEAPEDTGVPSEAEAPAGTEVPSETEAPEDTGVPSEAEAPEETGVPSEAEAPEETGSPSEAEAPTETGVPSEAEAPAGTGVPSETEAPAGTGVPSGTKAPMDTQAPTATRTPGIMDLLLDDAYISTPTPPATSTPTPTPSPSPSPTPDRSIRNDADTFKDKRKVRLDEDKILPELREIYELNHDLVGWLYIDDTNIDYPVVQSEDGKFYLTHDFYGRSNANGQIILEDKCDPYTPSYNLVLSGHHMNSGAMFGRLGKYKDKDYWETHKIVEFDTLMARKRYVVFGAFYSADYDEHEEGFRYSADIQYKLDADMWLDEIRANQIYETGIQAEFGDEFITLTTCDHSRRYDGRFVVVARRIREGEKIL